ncbi:MAG: hypothetical protein QXE01_03585 [Sulfolobales archaeon]
MVKMELELAGILALGVSITFLGGFLFVNAIEYIGHRARWTGSFTGAVISPLFTSIPELLMFLVALYIYGGVSGEKIGIGTVLGQPFMAATVIFPVIFLVALIGYLAGRRDDMVLEVERSLVIPYILFTAVYPIVLLPMVPSLGSAKYVAGAVLLILYFVYTYIMYRSRSLSMPEAEEAYLAKIFKADSGLLRLSLASIQLLIAVALIMIGSRMLVAGVDEASKALEASPIALAILITPLAGVLPESITAIIWAYRGRDTLAVAAMVGEKVLYSTIYPGIGLIITSWSLDLPSLVSVVIVEIVSFLILYHIFKGKLTPDVALIGLAGYAGFAIYVFHIL